MNLFLLFLKILILLLIVSLLIIPFIIISIIIKIDSEGPVIYWSKRVGIDNAIFLMPKFRTMKIQTKDIASHLLDNPDDHITKFGKLLRITSLDEIPQIYSILKNDMNFIGPRPALFNQFDLIEMRTNKNIHKIKPGITGYAQVNGRDNLSIDNKVKFDSLYCKNNGIKMNLIIILKTILLLLKRSNIKH
jgi:O-antigen biosynthesis protein WbqP